MSILLILSAFLSSFFYSEKLLAVESPPTEKAIMDRKESVMYSLSEVYPQMIPLFIV